MNHVRFSNWWYVGLLFTLVACQTPATPTTIPPATLPAPNTLLPAATLAPTANPVGAQTPTAVRATATQTTSNRVFHSADNGSQFRLPMTIAYGTGWAVQHDIKDALTIVHVGDPPEPDSQWWGPDINLVNGALVHEAGDIVSSQSASADKTKFIPWPADFFAYLTSLPGVKVIHRSEPITIEASRVLRLSCRPRRCTPSFGSRMTPAGWGAGRAW